MSSRIDNPSEGWN